MKDIYKVSEVVKEVLEEKPSTRNSDNELYIAVCTRYNPTVTRLAFVDVFLHRKNLGIPKMESVGRARRKIQNKYPYLRSTEAVTDEKYQNWKAVREYALDEQV